MLWLFLCGVVAGWVVYAAFVQRDNEIDSPL